MKQFQDTLKQLKARGGYRRLCLPNGLDLTSNDYLGMRSHPVLREKAIEALDDGIDLGAGGSRLLRGHTQYHETLEAYASEFFGFARTLYFTSGFQANTTLFQTLPDRHDVILYDSLIHASAREGIQGSKARGFKFAHNDLDHLQTLLKQHRDHAQTLWIAIESLYSMDGDFAPLKEMYDLAARYDAVLIVDEAHASGALGPHGSGLAAELPRANLVAVHTCGKAIGVAGALICASSDVIEYIINKGRGFIYSTAPIPLQALLVHESLKILCSEDGEARRHKLMDVVSYARQNFSDDVQSYIVPIVLGDEGYAVDMAKALQTQGYDIRAIRPPTVPKGTARLRLSLSSNLEKDHMQEFFDVLGALLRDRAA